MATISTTRLYQIFQGSPITATATPTILGLGPAGDPTSRRRLVHPDAANFDPIVYWSNPDRTFGIDNELLLPPIAGVARALDGSLVTRFDAVTADVVITEVWIAEGSKMACPVFLFRQLYEYLQNPPAFNAASQTYIQWSPQDRNAKTYNVELVRLQVGSGGDPTQLFDVTEFVPRGAGAAQGDPLAGLDDTFANEGGGLLDRTMTFTFKVVSEV